MFCRVKDRKNYMFVLSVLIISKLLQLKTEILVNTVGFTLQRGQSQRDVRRVNLNVILVNVLTRGVNVTEGQIVGTNQMRQIAVSWQSTSESDQLYMKALLLSAFVNSGLFQVQY